MKRIRTRPGLVITVSVAVVVAVAGCTGQDGSSDASGDSTLTIGARIDNNSFDPADLEVGNRIQYWQPVYDTLLRLDAEAEPQPNLASSWEYNDDSTVLTLQLRDDVTFIDGEQFDAEAVKANIEHLKAGSGQNQFMVASVDEVVVSSPTEVELRLAEPVPAMLSYLSWVGGAMASPAALESEGIAEEPVGSGPYVYDADGSSPGSEYRYTRNEDYWNAEDYPYDEYVVRPLNDLTPTLNALKTGEIDGALLEPAVAEEASSSDIDLETRPINWVGLLLADREGTMVPELADARVRQAINHVVDRQGMLDFILDGYGEATSQTFNTASQAFVPELDEAYENDLQRAQDLMDEAGVDEFTITMPQWDGPWNDLFPVIADQLGEIGVTVEWDKVPPDQAVSAVLSGDYPAAFFPLGSASAWQDIQTWIAPEAPWNMHGASDPELSQLISDAQVADGAEQDAAFQAVNEWLIEEGWFAPLFRAESVFGVTNGTEVSMQAQNVVPSLWLFGQSGD